ncbi:hypothetical protein FSP39_025259 [Pinctada imbricata]|uniref:C-type lectin domain-containing protein n=1 Tax=Pinctada imbricata TaxID=66713 RepID=A0AA89BLA3_PINIB|nr:hypothetical protein FSP39_025259 [Pinctada imbricata]
MFLFSFVETAVLFCIAAVVLIQLNDVKAITCFKCNGVAFPRDCPFVVECGPHEECFVDQLVSPDGNIKYNTGCRDRTACQLAGRKRNDVIRRQGVTGDLTTCTACCDVAHCNYGGCGEKGLPDRSKRGPICYDCYQQRQEAGCNQVKICGQDEECHIMRSPNSHLDFSYTTGCISKVRCGVLSILGKREDAYDEGGVSSERHQRSTGICFNCCNGDLCNKACSPTNTTGTSPTIPISVTNANTMTTSGGKSSTSPSNAMATKITVPISQTTSLTKSSTTRDSAMSSSSSVASTTIVSTSSSSSSSSSTTKVPHNCSADTLRYNNHCYYFSTEIKYWEESRQLCKGRNAHLLKIDDMNEELFIEKTLRGLMTAGKIPATLWGYYMGAHLVQGQWEWEDGTPVVFDDWGLNEPDHPDFQIFGLIFMPGHYAGDYKWGSHSDMQGTSRYICESVLH